MKLFINYPLEKKYMEKILEVRKDIEITNSLDLAEAILTWNLPRKDFLKAKNLKWIQATGAGVEQFLYPELINSEVILTNASGVHPKPIAEHTFALILSFTRNIHKSIEMKREKRWSRDDLLDCDELTGKTIGIIGYGRIGQEIARIAKCFGMKIIALKRNLDRKNISVEPDILLEYKDLNKLLSNSDIVVISAPLTFETQNMIGEKELKIMKPNSILVNIGRGKIIDEKALIKALKEKWIKGALLDVFYKEPLPYDSSLWELENVIFTPHISGVTPYYDERLIEIFITNLKAYPDVSKMINVVDKKLGY